MVIDEAVASRLGIAIVHQEGSLVPQLSIAENIFAGHAPTSFLGMVDRREMHRRAGTLMKDLGVPLNPATLVRTLPASQAQIVEIAKALSRELRLLVLDEPTSALTLTETERLFVLVRRLRDTGVAVIYISPPACRDLSTLRSGHRAQGRHGHRHPHGGRDQRRTNSSG